jgi:hypothetical protein
VQFGRVTRDWLAGYAHVMAPISAPFGSLRGKTPPANARPAAALESYAGDYANDYYGPARIEARGDGLVLTIGPNGMAFPLRHWNGDEFVYTPTGENAPDGSVSSVTFRMGTAGKASALAIEFYADSGMGDFVRQGN